MPAVETMFKQERAFLKKSAAKNFCSCGLGRCHAPARKSKSFLLLFFKKEALAY
jgi:hypothetical protein